VNYNIISSIFFTTSGGGITGSEHHWFLQKSKETPIGYRGTLKKKKKRRRIFISPIAKTLLQYDHNV